MKWCAWVVMAVLAMGASTARAELSVDFYLNVSPGHFSGGPSPNFFPGMADLSFVTGLISSVDGVFQARTTEQGWEIEPATFANFADMKTAAQQPWYLLFDEGLSTERRYDMSLNLAGLQESDILPPTISFPAQYEMISTFSPEFQFELGLPITHSYSLYELSTGGQIVPLVNGYVAPGTTTLVSGVTLANGSLFYFGLGADVRTDQWGFSAPVDSEGVPLEDWDSHFHARLDTINMFYTILPEPGTYALLACGVSLMLLVVVSRSRTVCDSMRAR